MSADVFQGECILTKRALKFTSMVFPLQSETPRAFWAPQKWHILITWQNMPRSGVIQSECHRTDVLWFVGECPQSLRCSTRAVFHTGSFCLLCKCVGGHVMFFRSLFAHVGSPLIQAVAYLKLQCEGRSTRFRQEQTDQAFCCFHCIHHANYSLEN